MTAKLKSVKDKGQKGQLLIEAMVAVSLVVVGLLGIFSVLSQTLGLNRVAADQYVAVGLASEGIEVVKNLIDGDFIDPDDSFGAFLVGNNEKYCPIYMDSTSLEDCVSNSNNVDASFQVRYKDGYYGQNGSSNDRTKFKRYVYIQQVGPAIEVRSVVFWTGRGGIDFDVELVDKFYNWRTA